ncbi:CBS domain-containing protein [Halorussus salinus]|uniref:CBS domain-containing protein n=1 Tax=Halorussus salinus TaxID=1364935 RepID=UPI0010928500|nr:CBS domain-containing protein [Halorussus salinus]
MQVSELMTERVVTIDVENTLQLAANRMLHYGVGSIIVLRDERPTGIITRSDAVAAGARSDEPFSRLSVERVMTDPVVTVQPTATVSEAVEVMTDNTVKHLPVAADGVLCGIVTSSDIVYNHEELRHQIEAIHEREPAADAERESDEEGGSDEERESEEAADGHPESSA